MRTYTKKRCAPSLIPCTHPPSTSTHSIKIRTRKRWTKPNSSKRLTNSRRLLALCHQHVISQQRPRQDISDMTQSYFELMHVCLWTFRNPLSFSEDTQRTCFLWNRTFTSDVLLVAGNTWWQYRRTRATSVMVRFIFFTFFLSMTASTTRPLKHPTTCCLAKTTSMTFTNFQTLDSSNIVST